MTIDLPNESCAGQREEVPDKGYSTGYFTCCNPHPSTLRYYRARETVVQCERVGVASLYIYIPI
jgi:hypothetical protein